MEFIRFSWSGLVQGLMMRRRDRSRTVTKMIVRGFWKVAYNVGIVHSGSVEQALLATFPYISFF